MDELTARLLSPPRLEDIASALFIQPHPDDNEIGAGGVIASLTGRGAKVWCLTVTDDRAVCPASETRGGLTLRQREALAAQEALGAEHAGFLGFCDKTDARAEEIAAKIVPVIRRLRPAAVFSVDPRLGDECHRDHIKTGWAVRYAVLDAAWEAFQPGTPPWETPVLGQYFTERPNVIADITPHMGKKLEAVRCHASQCSPELELLIERQAAYFGAQNGGGYGEALRLLSFLHLHCFNLPVGLGGRIK